LSLKSFEINVFIVLNTVDRLYQIEEVFDQISLKKFPFKLDKSKLHYREQGIKSIKTVSQ